MDFDYDSYLVLPFCDPRCGLNIENCVLSPKLSHILPHLILTWILDLRFSCAIEIKIVCLFSLSKLYPDTDI